MNVLYEQQARMWLDDQDAELREAVDEDEFDRIFMEQGRPFSRIREMPISAESKLHWARFVGEVWA